jgi:hypothetical protein
VINFPERKDDEMSVASGQVAGRFELAHARISACAVVVEEETGAEEVEELAIVAAGARPGTSFGTAGYEKLFLRVSAMYSFAKETSKCLQLQVQSVIAREK